MRRIRQLSPIAFVSAILALILALSFARADEPEWSAAAVSVRITPEKPVPLAGYAARKKPHEKVDQDIYAKALALKDAQGNRAILLTMDLCTLPRDVAEGIRARIIEKTGLTPAAVVLSCSHSHSVPIVALSAGTPEATIEYTRWFQDKVVSVAEESFAHTQPAKLSWGSGTANFAMNRREFTDKGVILGVNPRGLVDRTVPVLRVDGADGKPFAVLFGYACHNTTNPASSLGVSGDYAGYAKAYVQQQFPGAEAMFMMGCGGDANPFPRQQMSHAPAHGEELGKEVSRVLGTKLQVIRGPLKCVLQLADLPLQTPDRDTLQSIAQSGSPLNKEAAKQMLSILDGGGSLPATYPVPVGAWQFGGELTLLTLPDEVVVDYVPRLEDALGPMRLWIAGYCHEVTGYIPSKRVLREGGYETRGLYFDTGWFAPATEDTLVTTARDAALQAGRKPSHTFP